MHPALNQQKFRQQRCLNLQNVKTKEARKLFLNNLTDTDYKAF